MRKLSISAALLAATVGGCVADEPDVAVDEAPVTNPDSNTVPPPVVQVFIHGVRNPFVNFSDTLCTGVVVDPHWVLTSAHCFGSIFLPPDAPMTLTVDGFQVDASDVHFHPGAWSDGQQVWSSLRPDPDSVIPGHDLALMFMKDGVSAGHTPALLYHPANANPSLAGHTLKVAGLATGPKTGHETAGNNEAVAGGALITANRSPSGLEHGDSGGPAFVTVSGGLPASVPFLKTCAPAPGGANAEVLVGINESIETIGSTSIDRFTQVYVPANLDWMVGFLGDLDHDGVCDGIDNCPLVSNNQDNCNSIAETHAAWTSNGAILGDACDPTPCAVPSLAETDAQVMSSSFPIPAGDGLVTYSYVKDIADELDLTPILGDGSTDPGEVAETLFCLCRNADGSAIDDAETCAGAPFYCHLDPRELRRPDYSEAGGPGGPGVAQTYWHQITTKVGAQPSSFGAWLGVSFPGPTAKAATWDYVTDYTAWHMNGWITDLGLDPKFGFVRDMMGVLWTSSSSTNGAAAHGFPDPNDCWSFGGAAPICSVSDAYTVGVGPETREVISHYRRLPQYKPNPPWSYCAMCGDKFQFAGESVSNPAPFVSIDPSTRTVTAWTSLGGVLASNLFTSALIDSLTDSTRIWIGASEPVAIAARASSARAMLFSADGTQSLGQLARGSSGFDVRLRTNAATHMAGRSGFGAAYSRVAEAVFIAGGRNAAGGNQADLWTFHTATGAWSNVSLDTRHVPVNVLSSVFSHRDLRLWLISQPAAGERHLMRLDPATGTVDTDVRLSLAESMSAPYLVEFEDGRVVLAGTSVTGASTTLVGLTPTLTGEITMSARTSVTGTLAQAPVVAHGAISVPIQTTVGTDVSIKATVVPQSRFQ